ncbi:nucleoside hydrolase [Alienimonas californiensis]|uniref:Inosine-uridine preferring nucleoside hydrolase n=1 Tax=Alienimonas californiensis TaxID=2527989 RepID=A0A517P5L6_9PLAN|nr:nucleoside hydrolase [Alienimonas californiensis]QDT14662.1 Inosine-uridine preferring nucleoside hydrolase [Alienimonas californiensis]
MAPALLVPALVVAFAPPAAESSEPTARPVPIIFDTDMDTDCDDVGALAILHALADAGEAEILATPVSSRFRYSAPCTAAINAWYGRPELPVGAPKGGGADTSRGSRYAKQIAAGFPAKVATNEAAPDAVRVYREVLAARPDVANDPAGGVVVATVGYCTNLRDLLSSQPDKISPLSGAELVKAKVRLWVCMGGRYPEHRDPAVYGNFKPDPFSAVVAARDWPTPVVFTGLGEEVKTGGTLSETPENSPVRQAYRLYLGDTPARPSWDPIAVLYAVRPDAPFWTVREQGSNEIFPNGTNAWRDEPDDPRHRLLEWAEGVETSAVRDVLNELMTRPPAARSESRPPAAD